MKLESLKTGLDSLWENVAEGWRHLTRFAAAALTRFRPGERANLPVAGEVDDAA
jgi:HSP20 family protein